MIYVFAEKSMFDVLCTCKATSLSKMAKLVWGYSDDARALYPSLLLVQPRKTRPFITERLLMGRKESNQTNKSKSYY